MFGALLLRTHKIWPLIIIHGLIDLFGNLETFKLTETSVHLAPQEPQGIGNSIVVILALLPCFIYGLILLRKVNVDNIQDKLN